MSNLLEYISQIHKDKIKEIKWTDIKNIKREEPKYNIEGSSDTIYEKNLWSWYNQFTLSGPGSILIYAKNYIRLLIDFIKEKIL